MDWNGHLWNQIKNVTCDEIISALIKDGWLMDCSSGAVRVYINPINKHRVTIHYHPKKTFSSPKLLKYLISEIGWSEKDLRRLKFVK